MCCLACQAPWDHHRTMVESEYIASRVVRTVLPQASIKEAAEIMSLYDIGFLPVVSSGKTVGVLTDRDIALRSWHLRNLAQATVADIMTTDLKWVSQTANLGEVANAMAEYRVRRLLVHDDEGKLIGVISLDDIAVFSQGDETVGGILQKMIKPHRNFRVRNELANMPVGTLCQKVKDS